MPIIEYGKIVNKHSYKSENNIEKILASSAVIGACIVSLYSEFPSDCIMFISLMPIIWIDKYPLVKSNTDSESENESDNESEWEPEENIELNNNFELNNDNLDLSIIFKIRIINLANLLCKLSEPNNFNDYDYNMNYDELIYYFSKKLPTKSYFKSKFALQKLDPRIYLKIVNKEQEFEEEINSDKIIIPIRVKDSAWFGWPTINTQIIDIDDVAHFHAFE